MNSLVVPGVRVLLKVLWLFTDWGQHGQQPCKFPTALPVTSHAALELVVRYLAG